MDQLRVVPSHAEERMTLERAGWRIVERSWAAALNLRAADRQALDAQAARAAGAGEVRALSVRDVEAALLLDAETSDDYPGGAATAHEPLTADRATVSDRRTGHGVVVPGGRLAAMTYVDVDANGLRAEVDFTVVGRDWRRRGFATAVKAASLLHLLDTGVRLVRTGGSANNPAILTSNRALGFVVDEEWVTLAPRDH